MQDDKQKRWFALFAPPNNMLYFFYLVIRGDKMEYMTANQASKKWRISQRRVQILCADGRIPGVFKLGETWAIPTDVEKPSDNRRKEQQTNGEF